MIVMPGGTTLGLSANKKMSDKKIEELVESLKEIQPKPLK
jgi:ribonuclease HIII